ncbi:unnamed protein product [Didymodactylos carnosus]|uniref:FMN-dependent dehydrogenase domain-containing protein n=1 Tax=Didymodactylos carnosus TaxID=1234261 RepID=A0A815D392_9BILA|nr:unnamed protein product [Didymodactylos carnosus]CAF1291673.1 unnamed protein product [Didymodactylos carnosus]CAF3853728.1 unnamed protein product [Didymodactylos carnosus]CAF4098462.1 unnamed protein product [Didymodactylos carnosus]
MPPILSQAHNIYLLTIGTVSLYFVIKYYRKKRFEREERTSGYLQCQSLDDFELLAKKLLPSHRFNYFKYQAGYGCTYQACREYFNRHFRIISKVLTDVSQISLQTTIFGHVYDNPIMIAPTAFHCVAHDDEEWGTTQGAAIAKSVYIYNWILSTVVMDNILKTMGGI